MEENGCAIFVGAVILVIVIVVFVVPFVTRHWPWIVGILVLLVLIGVIWAVIDCNISSKEAQAKANRLAREGLAAYEDFKSFLTPCLIIDSNIWMNEDYDSFFSLLSVVCKAKNYKLSLYGPQFDEISNIKKGTTFGKGKNKRARIAINRIEEFQKSNWLNIEPVTVDARRGAYADPLLVKLVTKKAREGKACTFISDDMELRVRIRQHLMDVASVQWQIIEVKDILPKCLIFEEALEYGLIQIGPPGVEPIPKPHS